MRDQAAKDDALGNLIKRSEITRDRGKESKVKVIEVMIVPGIAYCRRVTWEIFTSDGGI